MDRRSGSDIHLRLLIHKISCLLLVNDSDQTYLMVDQTHKICMDTESLYNRKLTIIGTIILIIIRE